MECQLCLAIQTNDNEEWRLFRALRNQLFKDIDAAKKAYFKTRLEKSKDMWRLFNEESNDNSTSIPTKILIGEKYITSP